MSGTLSGMAFPFRIAGGGVALAAGADKLAQDLHQLLTTALGERVMLRGYGGGVHRRLQEPNDATLQALVRHEIEQALRNYLPQVRLSAPIRVTGRGSELTVTLEYRAGSADPVRRLALTLP